jgi:hypothetical protein
MKVASLGSFGLSWSATLRHCALAASALSCAKAVAMKAETTRRLLLPAWTRALRMGTDPAAPPRGVHQLGDGRLDALMGVGDHELDAT